MQTPSGILLIDKPAGMTSFGVVARVRRMLSQEAGKKVKVGHTGTLDPFATGLMIIVVGDYCKRAAEFSKLDKSYEATLHLGATSTTGDPEGEIAPGAGIVPTLNEIEAAAAQFRGAITQTPPIYSAIKIDGQRAYKLAREGKAIEMPTRTVTVHSLDVTGYVYPALHIVCRVSSGTYIRTLAEDMGKVLGTGAYVTALRRTTVGTFAIAEAVALEAMNSKDIVTL
ncbi:MAG TPA: tRNA pseudouridine(55) synthase TruB [Candidatus Saccharimonadales bacterium]|nr:tRNA pseudouridine(55) synthase TruB [Candidatus Saccharimonadales bacterium]